MADDDELYSDDVSEENFNERDYFTDEKKVDDNVDTIHIFQSQLSNNESFQTDNHHSNFVTINEDHMTEMQSNLDSLNLNTNNSRVEDFQTNNYDTLRQFHKKRYDPNYKSNDMKF
jgi:hypothetical protein